MKVVAVAVVGRSYLFLTISNWFCSKPSGSTAKKNSHYHPPPCQTYRNITTNGNTTHIHPLLIGQPEMSSPHCITTQLFFCFPFIPQSASPAPPRGPAGTNHITQGQRVRQLAKHNFSFVFPSYPRVPHLHPRVALQAPPHHPGTKSAATGPAVAAAAAAAAADPAKANKVSQHRCQKL